MNNNVDKNLFRDSLSTVKPNGIFGFKISDTMNNVFSRIKSQGMMSDEDIYEKTQEIECDNYSKSHIVDVEKSLPEDISRIYLVLNGHTKVLDGIQVYFKLQVNPNQHFIQLKDKLTLLLKQAPIISPNLYLWRCEKYNVNLSYLSDFDVSNEITLSFDADFYAI